MSALRNLVIKIGKKWLVKKLKFVWRKKNNPSAIIPSISSKEVVTFRVKIPVLQVIPNCF